MRLLLIAAVGATTIWAIVLLARSPSWLPWLTPLLGLGGMVAVVGLLFADRLGRGMLIGLAGLAVAVALAAPLTYSIDTAATAHSGSLPLAGPAVTGANAFGNGGPGGAGGGPGNGPGGGQGGPPAGVVPGQGFPGGGNGGPPAFGGGAVGGPFGRAGNGGPGGNGGGGLLNASTPSAAVTAALQSNASSYIWVLATVGANNAAGYQLAAEEPVMAIGGFNGTDNTPTLAQFEQDVAKGEIHYFIAGGGMGGGPGGVGASTSSSAITSWVESHFATVTIGGTTLYDLTQPVSGS